jgi:hypothetical protein
MLSIAAQESLCDQSPRHTVELLSMALQSGFGVEPSVCSAFQRMILRAKSHDLHSSARTCAAAARCSGGQSNRLFPTHLIGVRGAGGGGAWPPRPPPPGLLQSAVLRRENNNATASLVTARVVALETLHASRLRSISGLRRIKVTHYAWRELSTGGGDLALFSNDYLLFYVYMI